MISPYQGRKFIRRIVQIWSLIMLKISGIKLKIVGLENIPDSQQICFVSNHQSNHDISILVATIPMLFGFIAKKELKKYLPLRVWMDEIGCLFIDRKRSKEAIRLVTERINGIKNNKPLLIFPEGKRSRTSIMGSFKGGSLKRLIEHNIEIVPITINGSYLCYEQKNRITPGKVEVIFHKSIKPGTFNDTDSDLIIDQIFKTIQNGLSN